MRKPIYTNTNETFQVKAKNVKKGDTINVGDKSCKVLSNSKNNAGDRVLVLKPQSWSSSTLTTITLTLPKSFKTRVSTRTFVNHQK